MKRLVHTGFMDTVENRFMELTDGARRFLRRAAEFHYDHK